MKLRLALLTTLLLASPAPAAEPLRVFLRGGPKTHGPAGNGLHEHERWLNDWKKLLAERGATVDGAMQFPSETQLEQTDVLVMFAAEAGTIAPEQRGYLEKFLKRGGGMVAIHDAVCGTDAPWFKTIVGGAWEHRHSKWFEGEISFYYLNHNHPITEGCSNFDIDDEVYWDLHLQPEATILAASWKPDPRHTRGGRAHPHIYDVIPQMWVYERSLEGAARPYRAFVSILGHKYGSFEQPHYRAVLLRGIAWAGQRDVNSLCAPEELATLRYPEGGPTAPEKASAKLELHPDFAMRLVAAEPLINKPIALDWDPAGRLWVAETPEYPNGRRGIKPEQAGQSWKDHGGLFTAAGVQDRPARDRISILADTDGDGRMDKKEVFYEGLELVTSFVFHRDGVIVAQAPDILWLRDTDGDGRAEKVEKLYSGLGTFDTHAVVNNLRWGFDGWIYATHGYSAGTVKSGDGAQDFGRINSGVVRFKPDGSAFEQYCSKGGNTWGLDVASDNEIFFTQPTSGDLLNHVVLPERTLARGKVGNTASFKPVIKGRRSRPLLKSEQMAYVQIDVVGGFTASAGCAIYGGGAWPEPWDYNYFTTEPTINIVHHEVVRPDGATFTASKNRDEEFIGGRDLWFRPIETRIGPDGGLYLLDFCNQAVIHNDTRGPRHNAVNAAVRPDRDHYFGRVWRVDHRQAKTLEIPNLAAASTRALAQALQHPNRHVRLTAQRLLVERNAFETVDELMPLVSSFSFRGHDEAKAHALWVLHHLKKLPALVLSEAITVATHPTVAKNALRIAAEQPVQSELTFAVLKRVKDADARVRLEAIAALGAWPAGERAVQEALLDVYPDLSDPWLQSAAVGVAAQAPLEFAGAALGGNESLASLMAQLSSQIAGRQDAALAARLVQAVASKPEGAAILKTTALENLSKALKTESAPPWSDALQESFRRLLASTQPGVAAAALPLLARWDQAGALAGEIKPLVATFTARLNDASRPDDERAQLAASLLGVRQYSPDILPAVAKLLGSPASATLQRRLLEALGSTTEPRVGLELAAAYPKLSPELQEAAFAQIIKRSDWALALVDALKDGKVGLGLLGPGAVHRLRTHSDPAVGRRAGTVIDELRGPEVKEKEELIAKFEKGVTQPGDVAKGKELFTQNCAVCHKLNNEGKDLGPDLTGMGAHGAHELLVHVLDPNRFVEPNFIAYNVETKDDQAFTGMIVRENSAGVVLRDANGETEVKTGNISSRASSGRSLMPEGFEALGADGLRDLFAYLTADDAKFKILDLKAAFTADSREGIFMSKESKSETLSFKKFGIVRAEAVPFEIMSPARTATGRNVMVLKGGQGFAKTLPQKVEIHGVGVRAGKLHILGGIGAWAWPCCGDDKREGLPVAKVTVHYESGEADEFILKNGVEIVDYIDTSNEVPGSKQVPGLVSRGQVRWFSRVLTGKSAIERIALESFDNAVAPAFVALTAELSEAEPPAAAAGAASAAPAEASAAAVVKVDASAGAGAITPFQWAGGVRTLIVGGGSAHDFERWFHQTDKTTLTGEGSASVNYTEQPASILPALRDIDLLYLSNNQPLPDPALRRGILDFAQAGKGLLLVHPALWYNWKDWPEYNRLLVGGGSRSHDKYGEFEVNVDDANHAVMAGVPAQFRITDELYHLKPDPAGTPMQVLATGRNLETGQTYPVVWLSQHPQARIVCISLGHDGKAHEHPAYQRILRNSAQWAARPAR